MLKQGDGTRHQQALLPLALPFPNHPSPSTPSLLQEEVDREQRTAVMLEQRLAAQQRRIEVLTQQAQQQAQQAAAPLGSGAAKA